MNVREMSVQSGNKYWDLTVIQPTDLRRFGSVVWECMCICGNTCYATQNKLKFGNKKSCGCRKSKVTTERNKASSKHGHLGNNQATRTYQTWKSMHRRCADKNNADYGGRGIQICSEWFDFKSFLADMGERPAKCTIDRIDSDGNYEPRNCRWASDKEQQSNRRDNVRLEHDGKSLTVAQWAEAIGCKRSALAMRLAKGWSVEEALTKPFEFRQPRKPKR